MKAVHGSEVLEWPEFKALMKRLSFPLKDVVEEVTIYVPVSGPVEVTQTMPGVTSKKSGKDNHLAENRPQVKVGMYSPGSPYVGPSVPQGTPPNAQPRPKPKA